MQDNIVIDAIKKKMLASLDDDDDNETKKKFMALLRTDLRTRQPSKEFIRSVDSGTSSLQRFSRTGGFDPKGE